MGVPIPRALDAAFAKSLRPFFSFSNWSSLTDFAAFAGCRRDVDLLCAVVDLFVCNFESGLCGVLESGLCGVLFDPTASFNWTRVSGFDTSNVLYTGPISGQGGSRWYLLLDSRARDINHDARYVYG